jgi:hypothetical protein
VFSKELLPDRQLTATASPGRPHEDDKPPACELRQGDLAPVKVRERDVRDRVTNVDES